MKKFFLLFVMACFLSVPALADGVCGLSLYDADGIRLAALPGAARAEVGIAEDAAGTLVFALYRDHCLQWVQTQTDAAPVTLPAEETVQDAQLRVFLWESPASLIPLGMATADAAGIHVRPEESVSDSLYVVVRKSANSLTLAREKSQADYIVLPEVAVSGVCSTMAEIRAGATVQVAFAPETVLIDGTAVLKQRIAQVHVVTQFALPANRNDWEYVTRTVTLQDGTEAEEIFGSRNGHQAASFSVYGMNPETQTLGTVLTVYYASNPDLRCYVVNYTPNPQSAITASASLTNPIVDVPQRPAAMFLTPAGSYAQYVYLRRVNGVVEDVVVYRFAASAPTPDDPDWTEPYSLDE